MKFLIILVLLCFLLATIPTFASAQMDQSRLQHDKHLLKLEESCASITTGCNDCYEVMGCHFCEFDHQCHAIGSWYGCLSGAPCQQPECLRHVAEFKGYDKLSVRFVLTILAAAIFLLILLIVLLQFCFFGCYYFKLCLGKQPHDIQPSPTAIVISPSSRHPTYIIAHHYTNNRSGDLSDSNINNNHSGNRQMYTELIDNDYIPPPQINSVQSTENNR